MDNLKRQRVIVVNACPMCLAGEESIDHLLLNCSIAQHLWRSVLGWFHVYTPIPHSLLSLLAFWTLGVESKRERIMRSVSFLATIWSIWKERNFVCYEGGSTDVNILVEKVKYLVALWVSSNPLFKGISVNSIIHNWKEVAFSHPQQTRVTPIWCPPTPGALKLNFDGSAFGNPDYAGVEGIIRNTEGTTLLSYSGPAGFC